MNRIASNEEKISELSVSRPLLRLPIFEIQANKMLEGALLYRRSVFNSESIKSTGSAGSLLAVESIQVKTMHENLRNMF